MVSNLYTKKNMASVNVLKTLSLLIKDNYTMTELVQKLNSEEKSFVFNNNTVSKYINTCRYCGIQVDKLYNKYVLSALPFGLKLSQNDFTLFEYMQNISVNTLTNRSRQILNKFIEKINKFSGRQISVTERGKQKITLFENAIQNKKKVKIHLRTHSSIICIPVSVTEDGENISFNVLYKDKEKSIKNNKISFIELLDERFFEYPEEKAVVFRLFNGLEKRYTLRENEKLVNSKSGEITISCMETNKEVLFSRLIRYDCCCEILYPVSYREEFKKIIKATLNNYEV